MRIVTLSLLGIYVDQRILYGELHKSGGIPFFIVALAMLAPILWILRRSEKKSVRTGDKGLRAQGNNEPRDRNNGKMEYWNNG